MAKIVLTIDDTETGDLAIAFTSNVPLPDKYEEWTPAQIFVAKLHDTINTVLES